MSLELVRMSWNLFSMQRTLCLVLITTTRAFNFAPEFAQVYSDPLNQGNEIHFGYTVSLYQSSTNFWLLVGAPKANSSLPSHVNIVEPGVLYKCNLESAARKCDAIILDRGGNGEFNIPGYTPYNASDKNVEMRDHAWIGGALDVQDREDGDIVTCGARWKNVRWGLDVNGSYEDKDRYMNGVCYRTSSSLDAPDKLLPLVDPENQIVFKTSYPTLRDDSVWMYQYGQAGFAAHFVQNSSELQISAPGVLKGKGIVVRYQNRGDEPDLQNLITHGVGKYKVLENFGYSLASGRFTPSPQMLTAVGAPSSGDLRGAVFFLRFRPGVAKNDVYEIAGCFNGTQLGEYFGATLCVADVNGDGIDDLLVGAPLYSKTEGSDEGRVYVFLNASIALILKSKENICVNATPDVILKGSSIEGARFGTSISNIGDVNADGYDDIAVGAPYEVVGASGNGSIYIFHGRRFGSRVDRPLEARYSQRITAEDLQHSQPITGFGISISRGLDVDGNLFKDIAVGAYDSNHAVLIKSYPVIKLQARITSSLQKLDIDTSMFTVHACLKYESSSHLPFVDVLVKMSADPSFRRAQFVQQGIGVFNMEFNVTLTRNREKCTQLVVRIANLTEKYYTKPIEVHMKYQVNSGFSKPGAFNKTCPVVDPKAKKFTSIAIPYSIGCNGIKCRTDLRVTASVDEMPLVVGKRSGVVTLRVFAENSGELAFLSMANISYPSVLSLMRMPTTCQAVGQNNDDVIFKCLLLDYFLTGTSYTLDLEFDGSSIPEDRTRLNFAVVVYSDGDEQTLDDNKFRLMVPLQRIADISLSGLANQTLARVNRAENIIFSHTYSIRNFGPSPLSALVIDFEVPVTLITAEGLVALVNISHPTLSDDNKTINCTTTGSFINIVKAVENRTAGVNATARAKPTSFFSAVAVDSQRPAVHVNCSTSGTECVKIHCDVGSFHDVANSVLVNFQMSVDMHALTNLLDGVDAVIFSSTGVVSFNGAVDVTQTPNVRPDTASVQTEILGDILAASLPLWILIVAIAAGLLVLIIIIGICISVGFFKRGKKEELNNLKTENPPQQPLLNEEAHMYES